MLVKIVIIVFILIELSNVIALYFFPGSKRANSVGVFSAWEESKNHPQIHDFVKYLVNWVAGVKLILLLLLGVLLLYGDEQLQRINLVAMAIATLSFYGGLFPLIRKMDRNGQIKPRNYSIILSVMITSIILLFVLAALI
jgi:hypothetical protein